MNHLDRHVVIDKGRKRRCVRCRIVKPLNRNYFGFLQNGSFRKICRTCIAKVNAKYRKKHKKVSLTSIAFGEESDG